MSEFMHKELTAPNKENATCVVLMIFMALLSLSWEQSPIPAIVTAALQSMEIPSNRMSIMRAVKNGVVGLSTSFIPFMANGRNGSLSRWTAINPP